MSDAESGRDSDSRFDEANAWFFRLQSPDVTEDEKSAFQAWLDDCPANRLAWEEASALTQMLRSPARRVHEQMKTDTLRRGSADHRPRKTWVKAVYGSAAVILVLIGGLQGPTAFQNAFADHYTGIGERRTVELSDGSTVEMNTNSAINIDFSDGYRRVSILRGEAFFVVGKGDVRPFVVVAGDRNIHDIGTAFDVKLASSLNITVEEGAVQVRRLSIGPEC